LKAVRAPPSEHYVVTSPGFFRALEKILGQHPLGHWRAYLRWQLVHGAAPTLARALVDENFDFFGRALAGQEQPLPRWRRCVRAADRDLGEALGQAYVERAFPPESRTRTAEMVRAVEGALGQDIQALPWMSPATREQALAKLRGIEDKIGYPARWRDYSGVKVVRTSYRANVAQASSAELGRWIAKVGRPVDRGEWQMTPPTINAYYDPQLNTVNFPAGILQPPYFDPTKDDAVNYGAMGMIVGHEIIHGFDDQGRKFDARGNLRDWWTAEDARRYDERARCISDQYTQEVPQAGPGVKQNGLLTLGEDTADNGGLRLALMALESGLARQGASPGARGPDGWTPRQRFFLSYGFSWCQADRPETVVLRVTSDPHSLPVFRVNRVLSNLGEFREAFGCKAGQGMVRENACRVW
jgi:endothelin-converting enzyme/putative endopeptidase